MSGNSSKFAWILLGLLFVFGTAIARWPEPAGVKVPAVSHYTSAEREDALARLRAAWDARPAEVTELNERAERVFLNRLAYFVRNSMGTEAELSAMRLWNYCYRTHSLRYGDFLDVP